MLMLSNKIMSAKELHKLTKFQNLLIEITKEYDIKKQLLLYVKISIVLEVLGMIKKNTDKQFKLIPRNIPLSEIQKLVLMSTAHLYRKIISI